MHIDKLRITDANGLVPAGQYFKLVADALREANAREARCHERAQSTRSMPSRPLEVVQ